VHRLADPMEAGLIGLSGSLPALPPGRYVDAVSGLVAQVAVPDGGWEAAVAAIASRCADAGPSPASPAVVRTLPAEIEWSALATPAVIGADRPWSIPIGVADDDLAPIGVPLWDSDHVLVAGPARSGRTTVLATIAGAVLAADPSAAVLAIAGRRSWLGRVDGVRVVGSAEALDAAVEAAEESPTFVLVDDAEGLDDMTGTLERLAGDGLPALHIVAAGRAEVVRGLYNHWTKIVRRSRLGVLLRPNLDLDGDLLGTTLPRRVGVPLVPGRGFVVVDGAPRLAHLALPT
jgi:S-DNA-T family DNA segregation ATPase FtsK/SpoIIIE